MSFRRRLTRAQDAAARLQRPIDLAGEELASIVAETFADEARRERLPHLGHAELDTKALLRERRAVESVAQIIEAEFADRGNMRKHIDVIDAVVRERRGTYKEKDNE